MDRTEILRKTGHMRQLVGAVPVIYGEGRAAGMNAWQIRNGSLHFTVMRDKCLDIAELSYKGINLSFLSKPGLQGRNHYDTNGEEALRSIMGGMLFTCGLENICAPWEAEGRKYPMHGRIRTTPAESCGAETVWREDSFEVSVWGEMREAELFGENLVLKRRITTKWPEKTVHIKDVIENQGFRSEPAMLLYHFNAGYPFLDEGTRILLPSRRVTPRDEEAKRQAANWNIMEAPEDNLPEAVFLHELEEDGQGNTWAGIVNDRLGIGLRLDFSKKSLPYFMEWKSRASGDYVVGLEPANSSVYGRKYHEERGDLHMLGPQESETIELSLTILEGEELEEMRGRLE